MELEVKRLGEEQEALLFRENSIGSKSIESFLKLVCRNYLNECLSQVVRDVISNSGEIDCEVDKERKAGHNFAFLVQTTFYRTQSKLEDPD